jgi:hypothetical protein
VSAELEPLLSVIARVRRAMPRNPDVMRICDEAEKMMVKRTPESNSDNSLKAVQKGKRKK